MSMEQVFLMLVDFLVVKLVFIQRAKHSDQYQAGVKSWFISLKCIQLMYSNDNTYLHNIVTCIMHFLNQKLNINNTSQVSVLEYLKW